MSFAPRNLPLGLMLTQIKRAGRTGDFEGLVNKDNIRAVLDEHRCSPGLFNAVMRMRVGRNWIRRNSWWAVVDEDGCTSGWRGFGL